VFVSRTDAAKQLAGKLLRLRYVGEELKKYFDSNPVVVLAITRGGAVIGDIIATRLEAKLDLVVSRKIGAPFNPELAIEAIMPDGTCFLNAGMTEAMQVPQQYIAAQTEEQIKEIDRRLLSYRGRRNHDNELEGKMTLVTLRWIANDITKKKSRNHPQS
jgi:putative phosphoribosyl transferase